MKPNNNTRDSDLPADRDLRKQCPEESIGVGTLSASSITEQLID